VARRVAWIGLGAMGSRMARQLLAAGFEVAVWNRTPAKMGPLVAAGARAAASPRAAAEGAEVVVTMVADPEAVAAVASGPEGLLAAASHGFVWVDMSTIGPAAARRWAAAAREVGVAFLDAPVSGSLAAAEARQLVILVGGETADLRRAEPVLSALGRQVVHLGGVGLGQAAKVAINLVLATVVQAAAEGLRLAQGLGVDPEAFLGLLEAGPAGAPVVRLKAAPLRGEPFAPQFALALMDKDLRLALEAARSAGCLPLPAAEAVAATYRAAVAQGLGAEDFAAIGRAFRPRTPAPDGGARGAG
jgi:3-hydroxyisobutyrate dehydrogenase